MQTRDRIVRSAARLFLAGSYQSVGIAELCAAADVRKGSFYHFFPSKADLAKAVIDLHAAELDRRLAAARTDGPVAGLRAAADAIAVIQSGLERQFGRVVGCPFGNLAAELSVTEDALRQHVAAVFTRWEAGLTGACRLAGQHGVLRDGVDPDRLAHLILAQAQGLILLAKVGSRPAAEISAGLHALLAMSLREDA